MHMARQTGPPIAGGLVTDTVKTANDAEPLVEQDRSSALLTVIFLCFSGMSVALMQTLVIPIQSELPDILSTSAANASWVVTITLLGAAVAMPIAGRGLQGLAMGFIPVGISLMREVVPPAMATTAVAAMSATLGVGGAIGLPLSAWIVQTGDWHTLFWVATGLAVLVGLGSVFVVPHVHDGHEGSFDFGGAVGLAIGLVALLVGVTKGNTWGWSSGRTLGSIALGVVVLLAWGWFELRRSEPLCDLRVTARRPVLLTNIAAVAIGFGMMAQAIVFPQLLQLPEEIGGLDQTLLAAGLWMAPGGLMMLAFAPVASYLMRTFGAKYALALGAAVLGCGYLLSFFLMSAPWQVLVASLICSAGVGIGYAAMPTLIMDAVPMNEAGSAVGINALMRSVGTTVAAAVMAAILTSSDTGIPTEGAFKACFLVATVAAVAGGLLALTIPRTDRVG